jgi:hypothetical protein
MNRLLLISQAVVAMTSLSSFSLVVAVQDEEGGPIAGNASWHDPK